MFCKNCGNMMPDNAKYCDSCGAQMEAPQQQYQQPPQYQPPQYQPPQQQYQQPRNTQGKASVGFLEAVKLFFTRYFDFKGRSRRSEYFYAVLFNMIVSTVIAAVLPDIAGLWSLAVLIPGLAVAIRRLHDAGKSGWYYLWILVPIVGSILILIAFFKDSDGDNQWGPSTKY